MKNIGLLLLLVSISFSYSYAQMQTSIVSPNKEIVQWEKNNTNTENAVLTQDNIKQTLVENEMINIPLDYNGEAGIFIMGEEGVTTNTFEVTFTYDFDISKYMITNQEYAEMLNYALGEGLLAGNYQSNITVKNAQGFAYELLDMDANWEGDICQIEYLDDQFVVKASYHNHPVIFATWFGAAFYCNMRSRMEGLTELYDQNPNPWARTFYGEDGYRLPTEHEWEYAATYNDERHYPWGNETATPDYASFGNEYAHSTPVDQYPLGMSQLGLMDMAGNVSEFTNNYVFSYTPDPQLNPTGPDDDDRISTKGNTFAADAEVIKCHWRSGWIKQYYFMSDEYHTFGTNDVSFRILRSYAGGGVGLQEKEKQTNFINNYPNPVSNYTTFIVSQELNSSSSIAIYNSLGKLVQTIESIDFSRGNNAFLFDATSLVSGMYFESKYS
ncbi:MAG: hypothetical protein B7C24_12645 [Bacteroidetes bacterium 4572_77]|nr:MAG: hypothetical protein B7C24_12645 [Bacteroidetes bacterium 4572_77]